MSTAFARFAAACLAAFTLSGCLLGLDAPEEKSETSAAKRNDVLQATVNRVPLAARGDATSFSSLDLGSYSVTGATSSTSSISLRMVGVGRVGTFSIGGQVPPYVTVRVVNDNGSFGNVSTTSIGTLTVTELTSQRIGGTFAFTAPRENRSEGVAMVTDGSFSIAIVPPFSVPIDR